MVSGDKTLLAVEQNKTLIPFGYGKYLAWGFPDSSIRIGNYDSDKVGRSSRQFSFINFVFR